MVCCIGNVFFAAGGDEQGGRLWGAGVPGAWGKLLCTFFKAGCLPSITK